MGLMRDNDSLIGQHLGKYRIQAELGRGGMGVVYRGYDPVLDRPVAIKVLPLQLTYDGQFVQRFHQEAVLAARLHHPGIVPIYDVGEQNGIHYIVMQFLEGMTLEAWLQRQGPLAPAHARPILPTRWTTRTVVE
jgi:serine/threonine protein kinase